MAESRVTLAGSERAPIPGGQTVAGLGAAPAPTEVLSVSILVRRKAPLPRTVTHAGSLNREDLAANYGATAADLMMVQRFGEKYNLRVVDESALTRTVQLAGTVRDMERAFGTTLRHVHLDNSVYRERTGPITLPADVAPVIEGVFGLDNRPAAQPHFRLTAGPVISSHTAQAFSPLDVARLYNFPPGTGAGQTIAIIELGGGFAPADLNTYFTGLGLTPPTVTAVSVLGGANLPTNGGKSPDPDNEVMLDIEVVGAIAPQAHIKVYFAPGSDQGFLAAVNAAVHDTPTPAAVSISWGRPEGTFTPQSRNAFDQAFQNAAALSVPVTVASGDDGSTDGTSALDVDFPSSAPHALGCGGTHLEGGTAITLETVWNSNGHGTGGGVSAAFPKPGYQSAVVVPALPAPGGRGVPDVSGNAASETGYRVRVHGQDIVVGGTSAVAPLWAGLIARLAGNLGHRVPFLNPILYANSKTLRDITQGNNDVGGGGGHYQASPGWDPCTGLGSPDGGALLQVLKSGAPPPPPPSSGSTGTTGHDFWLPPPVPYAPAPVAPPAAYAPAPVAPPAGYAPPAPVAPPAGYAPPVAYAPPMAYAPPVAYAPPAGYAPPVAYAPPAGYAPPPAGYAPTAPGESNAVALVGLAALVATVATVAAVGIVAAVAISKDKS